MSKQTTFLNWIMMNFVSFATFIIVTNVAHSQIGSCANSTTKSYLHISHSRTQANPKMDSIAELVNYCNFDMLLLGGDLAWETSMDQLTLDHVDSVYSLSDPNTLWTFGNHDIDDVPAALNRTERNSYYAYYKNGITFLVLNTQDDFSNISGGQLTLLQEVADTISSSSHLIILHHKLIWLNDNGVLQAGVDTISNGPMGATSCTYCLHENNFYSVVYPILKEVSNKGTEVICLGGDLGFHQKTYDHLTDDNILFIASGIKSSQENNIGIVFTHNMNEKELTWEYKELSELSQAQDVEVNEVVLYPNPSDKLCYFNSSKEVRSLRIYDRHGGLLFEDLRCTNFIDTEFLHNGFYYVQFRLQDGATFVDKLLVHH